MTLTTAALAGLDRPATFLSPGQRFQSDVAGGPAGAELVVDRLIRDHLGLLHVVLRGRDGREISAFAEQVEAAIADGHLVPVAGPEPSLIPA